MKTVCLITAIVLAGALSLPAGEAMAKKAGGVVAALDTDHDGTVDLNEIDQSAEQLFSRLEKDKDGTLDRKEMSGRISKKSFASADPDNDGTLSKDEYLNMVQDLFKQADSDNDSTLDAKELRSKKGQELLRLTR